MLSSLIELLVTRDQVFYIRIQHFHAFLQRIGLSQVLITFFSYFLFKNLMMRLALFELSDYFCHYEVWEPFDSDEL